MKYAIFGDVHGNLIALDLFLEKVRPIVDGYVCTGDIVNYGPWSHECIERIKVLENLICVRGNHEDIFLGCNEMPLNSLVEEFTEFSLVNFTEFDWIESLPIQQTFFDFDIVHTIDGKYIYFDTKIELTKSTIIGHSHQQFIRDFTNGRLVNPGSLGQNRQIINVMQYMIFDTDTNSFESFNVKFELEMLLREMKVRGYSTRCIDYYSKKTKV
jgi:putative phosphoesterase